jgi:hypothetical protein
MAKPAQSVAPDVEITERRAKKFLADIMERHENIESARGTYMNKARREREAMTTIYEGLAALGVSQKASKLNVKIAMSLEKIKGWLSDLEAEDRKMAQRLAKAQGDKKQLMLFAELPPLPKETKAEKAERELRTDMSEKSDLEATEPAGAA